MRVLIAEFHLPEKIAGEYTRLSGEIDAVSYVHDHIPNDCRFETQPAPEPPTYCFGGEIPPSDTEEKERSGAAYQDRKGCFVPDAAMDQALICRTRAVFDQIRRIDNTTTTAEAFREYLRWHMQLSENEMKEEWQMNIAEIDAMKMAERPPKNRGCLLCMDEELVCYVHQPEFAAILRPGMRDYRDG